LVTDSVAVSNIFGERGLRYKRNVLAASLVATVILWAGTSLGDVSIFGVSLEKSNLENREAAAWAVLFAILGYQWIMLTYYGLTDWRIWRQNILSRYSLPPFPILFGVKVGLKVSLPLDEPRRKITKRDPNEAEIRWEAHTRTHDGKLEAGISSVLPLFDLGLIRRRFLAFVTIEFGLAFVWGFTCLAFALGKVFV